MARLVAAVALDRPTSEAALLDLVERLNADPVVDGILVQLPLPDHVDAAKVLLSIDPDKDVDGFHPINAGRLATGMDGFVPCTPLGCLRLLRAELGDLKGMDAVVIGRSNIVGKPMAMLLLGDHCTVTIAHSRTRDLPDVVRRADRRNRGALGHLGDHRLQPGQPGVELERRRGTNPSQQPALCVGCGDHKLGAADIKSDVDRHLVHTFA